VPKRRWTDIAWRFIGFAKKRPKTAIFVLLLCVCGFLIYEKYSRVAATPTNRIVAPGDHNVNVNSNSGNITQKN
jgi:hypothetical protein